MFDAEGGLWFTDHGKTRTRDRDRTGVFYASPDGSQIEEILFPLEAPNGIGLSPDGGRLYVAETPTARLFAWEILRPGEVAHASSLAPHGGTCVAGMPGFRGLNRRSHRRAIQTSQGRWLAEKTMVRIIIDIRGFRRIHVTGRLTLIPADA